VILFYQWPQDIPCQQETALHQFLCFFEIAVFVLNADHIGITAPVESANEATPVHFPQAGQPLSSSATHLDLDPA